MTRPMGLVGYLRYFGDMALCSPIEASWGRGTAVMLPSVEDLVFLTTKGAAVQETRTQ